MKITITNTFHNSKVTLNMQNSKLSTSQVKRAGKELCGISDCICGSMWSENHTDLGEGFEGCYFEPDFNSRGDVVGAIIVKY